MAHNSARIGRRRRVLNEEALAASAMGITARSRDELSRTPGDTPRYGAGANIENHPQVTDFVPRRYRVITLVMMVGIALGVGGELIANYSLQLGELLGNISPQLVTVTLADGLVAWTSATALLVAACYARLVYSLRRHRVDDNCGRYRVWKWASWTAVLLSMNSVVNAHAILAHALGYSTGWNVLPRNVGWWLTPTALLGGWLLLKVIRDASECRIALVTYMLGVIGLVTAGIACCWVPAWASEWHDMIGRQLPLLGNILLTTGTLLFARYVVLDVQGLIERNPSAGSALNRTVAKETSDSPTVESGENFPQVSKEKPNQDKWVDGSQAEDLHDDESGTRRLSKAERKRLRKQKGRRRAA